MEKKKQLSNRVMVYAVIWCICYLASVFALTSLELPQAACITFTVVTIIAFAIFMFQFYRRISYMDEVQIKIQMEAIVITFALGLLLLMTLGLLDLFIVLNKEDWSYIKLIPMFAFFYFTGLFISRRKYNFNDEKHD